MNSAGVRVSRVSLPPLLTQNIFVVDQRGPTPATPATTIPSSETTIRAGGHPHLPSYLGSGGGHSLTRLPDSKGSGGLSQCPPRARGESRHP